MRKKTIKIGLITLAVVGAIWLSLEPLILHYLNSELSEIDGYKGRVKDVDVYLFAGAIKIDSLEIQTLKDGFTKPFISLPESRASIHWRSLLRGRIVGELDLIHPIFNFEIEPSKENNVNTEVNWVEVIEDIGVLNLNKGTIQNGELNYLDRSTDKPVEMYIRSLDLEAYNLATVQDKSKVLPSSIYLSGVSLGEGKLYAEAKANLLKQVPDFDLAFKFTHTNLTAFNAAFNEYARIDMENGSLNFFTEIALKDSVLTGYMKPILSDIEVVDWGEKEDNPVRAVWEGFVGLVVSPFKNRKEDQLATKVPVEGRVDSLDGNTWIAIAELLKNAYVKPLNRNIENTVGIEDVLDEE